jgi:16S rRNA (cytidine1402-2'-O)-methyltransferase
MGSSEKSNSGPDRQAGILYLVATPIGNMLDITLRAMDILKTVDIVAAEDTRTTGLLLKNYGIRVKLESFHIHNEAKKKDKLINNMLNGDSVAVVSDAGTPGISDPAFSLVRDAIEAGIEVRPVPGANAAVSALIVSGLPTDRFYFGGFPPRKSGKRKRFFEELSGRPETLIFFESPHRLLKTLGDLYESLGDRRAAICRELTKKFEQTIRDTLSKIIGNKENLKLKGEFVIIIEGHRSKD